MTMREGGAYHYASDTDAMRRNAVFDEDFLHFEYTFENFFHPFVADLIKELNQDSIRGMLDPNSLQKLHKTHTPDDYRNPGGGDDAKPTLLDMEIDLSIGGPYANYNWELLYHIPVMIAVHLSSNQRFAEAQKWFHYVFDPTCTDISVHAPQRFWKFLAFRDVSAGNGEAPPYSDIQNINTLLTLLSTSDEAIKNPTQLKEKHAVLQGYAAMLNNPFQPHAIARTRPGAYQWYVVMKYLDNLISWGDSLFLQNTIETINEATLCYVLAANILGPRPQGLPQRGVVKAKNYLQLKKAGLDPMGNAMVELEGQFPFNLAPGAGQGNGASDQSGALFGIGRTLYFCIPANQTLLAYWDTVADRLFKIRNSENIQGVVQQLPLFDPPLDPGMLVKAAAAGIDIGSVVSGLNQPLGPVRCPLLIQKALELAGEVRSLGSALLASLEKGDAEQLALRRQGHEIELQKKIQDVRFLQWRVAQESTKSLLTSRATALERLHYYQHLLGLAADQNAADVLTLEQSTNSDSPPKLTEENFDHTYDSLVRQYDKTLTLQNIPDLKLVGDSSPGPLSGFSGNGNIYLTHNEDAELNVHLPLARDLTLLSSAIHALAAPLTIVPDAKVNLHFWGLGGTVDLKVGTALVNAAKLAGDLVGIGASWERDQASMASRYASYERRANDWLLQYNLAAHELMQIGRQILTSLIAEQIAYHDYQNVKTQVRQAQDIQAFLETKFTNAAFYSWQTSEITGLYYQYYRFACDIARKAEQTMKRELMRPELDATQFIRFNYWDTGHKGLLSGEALVLDLKRMEMAYHDHNKRELELTRHVSLRQLDPIALLALKMTGSCTVTVPEWLYDLDCPGLYMRRIKSVAVSVPCVVGPYTSINCTLSLQRSTLRVSPLLRDGTYARDTSGEDNRFVDYFGAADAIVTSSGQNDSGMFETNLRDERFLPFEGAGAESTWKLVLPNPKDYPAFDYDTIADVILHIRYTARQGVEPTKVREALDEIFKQVTQSNLALLFSLPHDFSTEWSAFVSGTGDFTATIRKDFFPYFVQSKLAQGKKISISGLELYEGLTMNRRAVPTPKTPVELSKDSSQFSLSAGADDKVLTRKKDAQVFLIIRYSLVDGGKKEP